MIDHVSLGVGDLNRACRFYEATLAALGLSRLVTRPGTIGFGKMYPELWINLRTALRPQGAESGAQHSGAQDSGAQDSGAHVCLRARTTAEVDAFHAAALGAGGTSDGAPGLRPHDRVTYYAAFVRDPDGNRVEAVTFPQT